MNINEVHVLIEGHNVYLKESKRYCHYFRLHHSEHWHREGNRYRYFPNLSPQDIATASICKGEALATVDDAGLITNLRRPN